MEPAPPQRTRLIYFSSVPWSSHRQRSHYIVRFLADAWDAAVLWVDPYPTRQPRAGDWFRASRPVTHDRSFAHSGVSVLRVPALPIEFLPGSRLLQPLLWHRARKRLREFATGHVIVGAGRPNRLALWAVEHLDACASFYDAMDDFPLFGSGRSRRTIAEVEDRLARRVDRLIVTAPRLQEKFHVMGVKAWLVPNACDATALPLPQKAPAALRFGYVGTIARWFDWDVVISLARAFPDAAFELIGPQFMLAPGGLPGNIVLRGGLPWDRAVERMRDFSVALIPFHDTPLTASVDPVKYYEYRALGIPVLSTRFGSMTDRGGDPGVALVDSHSDWAAVVARLLETRMSLEAVEQFRSQNDWSRRLATLPGLLAPTTCRCPEENR